VGAVVHPAPPPETITPVAGSDGMLERGAAIGRFVVLGLLGKGGMGEVYAAHDPELDRKVAIKLLRGGSESESPEGRLRLMREAQAIARVSHPNVVVVYDVGTLGKRVFIAMELIDGSTLRYWMHARQRSWPEILEVFSAAGRGLSAAHERELVHRDFKPDNVMIAADGQVRVMDFGLVQLGGEHAQGAAAAPASVALERAELVAVDEEDLLSTRPLRAVKVAPASSVVSALSIDLTRTGVALGTPAYMSPEQFRNEPTDARTDQFSFCVALYESIYGERPFQGGSFDELSRSVCDGQVRAAPEGTRVPAWIREVLLRGLRREATRRWPSMGALLAELEKQPAVASRRRFEAAAAARLVGIWEAPRGDAPVETPAKAEMREAFLSTGKAYARKAWDGASQVLDRYARRWSELYLEACEATHVREEQSAEVLDLRMACLHEGLEDLEALVKMFRDPTAAVVENAIGAASALGTLERCEDIELLRAVVRPPADPIARQEVERLRSRLAEVRAFVRVGRINEGLAAVGPLERAARELAYAPLLADVLLEICRLYEEQGAMDAAAKCSEEAALTALGCRHEEVAVTAAILIVGYEASRGTDAQVAEIWIRIGEALLRGMGGHDLLWGWFFNNRAMARAKQGRVAEALEDARLALGAKEKALGPDHPDVGLSIGNLAVYYDDLDQLAEAVVNGGRAVEIVGLGLGPDHPRTALILSNYSEFLARDGQWDAATAAAARAVAIFEREADNEGLFVFLSLTALGSAHLGAGRIDEALPILERANRIGESVYAPTISYRARARFALARALLAAEREPARAMALAKSAENDLVQSPLTPTIERELAAVASWMFANRDLAPSGGRWR
jgi:tetratricopeptide (TPR) repeat protein